MNGSSQQPFVLRAATHQDIPALGQICRESFPGSPRWLMDGGRKWWTKAMASETCEIWVAESPEGVGGFVLFVTDESAWTSAMRPTLWDRVGQLLALVMTPSAALHRIDELRTPKSDESLDGDALDPGPGERLFVELFAVSKAARRTGLGRKLTTFAVGRAAELGLHATCYRVSRRNMAMISLMRASGCRLVKKDPTGYLFSQPAGLDRFRT